MFQFVAADDEGVLWFDDSIAPGFEESSWSEVVDEMRDAMRADPAVALAFILGVHAFGVAAYFTGNPP